MNRVHRRLARNSTVWLAVLVVFGAMARIGDAQNVLEKKSPGAAAESDGLLSLEPLEIEPAEPSPDTLCKLKVKVRNRGKEAATHFAFAVKINGQEVPVYKKTVYVQTVPAASVTEIQLYNFWVTERGREVPADGQLRIEVELLQAHWMEVKTDEKRSEQKPLGKVDGLPVKAVRAFPLKTTRTP